MFQRTDAKSDKPAQVVAAAKLTELGRDPNDPEKTGSRKTIRDLRIYEGFADELAIAQLFAEQQEPRQKTIGISNTAGARRDFRHELH